MISVGKSLQKLNNMKLTQETLEQIIANEGIEVQFNKDLIDTNRDSTYFDNDFNCLSGKLKLISDSEEIKELKLKKKKQREKFIKQGELRNYYNMYNRLKVNPHYTVQNIDNQKDYVHLSNQEIKYAIKIMKEYPEEMKILNFLQIKEAYKFIQEWTCADNVKEYIGLKGKAVDLRKTVRRHFNYKQFRKTVFFKRNEVEFIKQFIKKLRRDHNL
jgi:hypothetical protein